MIPALLMRTSRRPKSLLIEATAASMDFWSVTSNWTVEIEASGAWERRPAMALLPFSVERLLMTTWLFGDSARASATLKPMPPFAPVCDQYYCNIPQKALNVPVMRIMVFSADICVVTWGIDDALGESLVEV
jgi:hypothetical protein